MKKKTSDQTEVPEITLRSREIFNQNNIQNIVEQNKESKNNSKNVYFLGKHVFFCTSERTLCTSYYNLFLTVLGRADAKLYLKKLSSISNAI